MGVRDREPVFGWALIVVSLGIQAAYWATRWPVHNAVERVFDWIAFVGVGGSIAASIYRDRIAS